jgi:competence protein ComFC
MRVMPKLLEKSKSIIKAFVDILLPPVCYVCGARCSGRYGLCDGCMEKIMPISPPFCVKCGRHVAIKNSLCNECGSKEAFVEKAWSCCHYKDTIKECIHLFKYNGYAGLRDVFGNIMADFVKKNGVHKEINLLVPVPIHSAKKRERAYNHASILASSLSKALAIPMDTKNLRKIRWTTSQSELDKDKRLKNVKDSFLVIDKNAFAGRSVLLIDDVYTTGATINECARVLLAAGADKVCSLTLARG